MNDRSRRHGRTIGVGLLTILAVSIAVLWAWNSIATDLAGLPQMAWRHALALCLLALGLAGLMLLPLRILGRNRPE